MPLRLLSAALVFGGVALLLAACDKNAEPTGARPAEVQAATPGGAATPTDPHAGMTVDEAHGGMNPSDPHAGMALDNPHGTPPAQVDPALALDGEIQVDGKLAGQVKPGDIVFLVAKKADEKGEPVGGPLAVARLDVTALPLPFDLDGSNAMMAGTKFEGPVVLTARVDRDGEARTREAGDVEGRVQATVPQKGVKLVLDTPVP